MRENTQSFNQRQEMRVQTYEIFHYKNTMLDSVDVHHHDFYEVYLFLGGKVEYSVEGRNYHLEPGDILMISPLELHRPRILKEDESYERIVLWINTNYLENLSTPQTNLTCCFDTSRPGHSNLLHPSRAQRANLLSLLGQLVQENYSTVYGSDVISTGILLQFLVELNRLVLGGHGKPHEELIEHATPLISQVLDYINAHYFEQLSLGQLAGEFYISKYHLSHEFNRVVGTSVYRYIILKRLVIAKQMLASGIPPRMCTAAAGSGIIRIFTAFSRESTASVPNNMLSRACTMLGAHNPKEGRIHEKIDHTQQKLDLYRFRWPACPGKSTPHLE